MEKKLIVLIFMGIFLMSFISAVPPVTTVNNFPEGYLLTESQQGALIYNQDFTYNFFVSNATNGVTLDDTDIICTFYMANLSGNVLYAANATYVDGYFGYWNILIEAGNFSYIGDYPYGLNCENGDLGGSLAGTFNVGYSGRILDAGEALLYIPLFLTIFFLFFVVVYGINMLPDSNAVDAEDTIVKISYLKYLRSALWFVIYIMLVGLLYIASNLSFAYSPDLLVAEVLFTLYSIAFSLTPVVVVVWFIWIFAQIIDDKKLKQLWKRGMFPQKI